LVTPENEIAIIDFERGMLGDMSGKNMRSLSQRLAGEQWIDIPTCKYIGTLNREDIYTTLQEKLAKKSLSAEHIDSS
jgi:predicted Ser/Thr protein kinase